MSGWSSSFLLFGFLTGLDRANVLPEWDALVLDVPVVVPSTPQNNKSFRHVGHGLSYVFMYFVCMLKTIRYFVFKTHTRNSNQTLKLTCHSEKFSHTILISLNTDTKKTTG